MNITVTQIGLMHDFGWLIIGSEDEPSRTTVKLTPTQLKDLAQQIISRLKEHSRGKREFYKSVEKELDEAHWLFKDIIEEAKKS